MNSSNLDEAAIFNIARRIDVAEVQRLYIEQACGDDQQLLGRLESLLNAYKQDVAFLERPAEGVPSSPVRDFENHDRQIGPYKLLEPIGEGGFGKVYMAEQTRPVRRLVALKIIKPGMDTSQVIARFESERQALALMSHPNIAQIIDGGETESGQPYFVMELVRGVPITAFCDGNHLPARERLKLFISVCQAIQHAHHKGVIHRDVKPSNVMVTLNDGAPVVKIIDFGVAKAVAQRLTEKTLFTAYGQMVGTPAYMSPEQASMSMLDVDTRSDIYSLGVLLYELLTGTTPIESARLREAGYAEIQRLIREVDPQRPSTRLSSLGDSATIVADNRSTDSKQLSRLLAGDLDWIVMKALEKDRNRRYASPGSFAEDVERYLQGDAVLAPPPTLNYRLKKFASRNRGAVMTAAVTAAALLAGTAIASWQAVVATRAKSKALTAAEAAKEAKHVAITKEAEAQAVVAFLENQILAAARPKGVDGGLGPDVTLRDAINASVPFVESSFKDQPLTEARLRETLGASYTRLVDGKAAAEQYQRAREIRERILGPDHPDTLVCVNGLGIGYMMQGRLQESANLYEALLPICKAKFGPDAVLTLQCMNNLGMALDTLGRLNESLSIHKEVFSICKANFGPDHRNTLKAMTNLAGVYDSLVLNDEALELRKETLERSRSKYGPDDAGTLMAMQNLGNSYRKFGRFADALRLDQECLLRRTTVLGVDHSDTLASLWCTAHDLIGLKRGAEAVPLIDDCLKKSLGKYVHHNFRGIADLRLRYFQKLKNVDECRRTAELWEDQKRTDALSLYQAAVCRGVTASLLNELNPMAENSARLVNEELDRAMAWLEKAVAAGYRYADKMETDPEFQLLHDRGEFKKLLERAFANQDAGSKSSDEK